MAVATSAHDARTQWGAIATSVHARLPEISSVSDLRRIARNLQSLVALEVDAASALVVPAIIGLEKANEQTQTQPTAIQIAVQAMPDDDIRAYMVGGSGTPLVLRPPPDLATHRAAHRLREVSGIALANFDDLPQARERFRLSDGASIREFTNFAGFRHVYLVTSSGTCVFGSFVPPTHATYLQQALAEIRAAVGT